MKKLKKLHSWTHCRYDKNRASNRVPAVGLGKKAPLSYKKARENADNSIAGSTLYGFVFGEQSDYVGIDVDVDPNGEKENATPRIPEKVISFLKEHPTHAHYSPGGHGIHIIYQVDEDAQRLLDAQNLKQKAVSESKGDSFCGDLRYRKSFLVFTEKMFSESDKIGRITYEELITLVPSIRQNSPVEDNDAIIPPGKATSGKATLGKETSGSSKIDDAISVDDIKQMLSQVKKIPSREEFKETLLKLPPTYSKSAEKACSCLPYHQPTSNYEYWVMVAGACAHQYLLLQEFGRNEECEEVAELFREWSSMDTVGFTNLADVDKKFNGIVASTKVKLDTGQHVTSFGTLKLLATHFTLSFPDKVKKGNGVLVPNPVSLRNLDALMEFEKMSYIFDSMGGGVCFKGPERTMLKYFCPMKNYRKYKAPGYGQICSQTEMVPVFNAYLQKWYGPSTQPTTAKNALAHLWSKRVESNAFALWVKSKPWDGIKRIQTVCDSIEIVDDMVENTAIYRSYIKKMILSSVGVHFFTADRPTTPAMVILTGVEHTYKTTWANSLLPQSMESYMASVSSETVITRGGADWYSILATNAFVVIDECEKLFCPAHEQKLKDSIDKRFVTYRDPYGVSSMNRPKTAVIVGTTNEESLFTGTQGTRKFWQVPVKLCRIEVFKGMDMQQLYCEALYELETFKRNHPEKNITEAWNMHEGERELTNRLNFMRRGNGTGVYSFICECFGDPYEREFNSGVYLGDRGLTLIPGSPHDVSNSPNAWTISSMTAYLRLQFYDEKVERMAVKYALIEYASAYTDTTLKIRKPFLNAATATARNKLITKGRINLGKSKDFYLMPPPLKVKGKDVLELVCDDANISLAQRVE